MFSSGSLGGADHQSSKNEKETRKKGKCLDKTSTQTLQQLRYSLFKYSLGLLICKQFSNLSFKTINHGNDGC